MPTATTVLGPGRDVEFHNVGALTSAWARPDVCSNVPIATSGLARYYDDTAFEQRVDNCAELGANEVPECTPGAARLNELRALQESPTAGLIGYHSPGLQCPEAWETVGVIAMNSGTPSASGVFSPTTLTLEVGQSTIFPRGNFAANMLTSVLAPAETAVACCPSGYTIDPWAGCYSRFPAIQLANKTGCRYQYTGDVFGSGNMLPKPSFSKYTWAYYGTTTVIGAMIVSWPTHSDNDQFSTSTVTLDASGNMPVETSDRYGVWPEDTSASGIAVRSPIWLVHSGDGSEGSDDKGDGESESESPSAARGLAQSPAWGAIFGVLAAWGVGMVAGVGLLAAW